jgi:hypothetical protein
MKGTINQINQGLRVKTNLKAGFNPQPEPPGRSGNHSQTLVREAKSLRVKTNLKAGKKNIVDDNHSQTLVRG